MTVKNHAGTWRVIDRKPKNGPSPFGYSMADKEGNTLNGIGAAYLSRARPPIE